MPLTAAVRSTRAPPAAHAFPSASVSSNPRVIGPGLAATTASVEERTPLLIQGLDLVRRMGPEDPHAVARRARHLGEGNRAHRAFRAEQHEPGDIVAADDRRVDDVAVARRHLDGSRHRPPPACSSGSRRCAARRRRSPAGCRSPSLTVTITSPGRHDLGQPGHGRVVRREHLDRRGVGGLSLSLPKAPSRPSTPMATIAPSAPAANGATRRLIRAFVREGGRIGLSSVGCTQMRSIRSGGAPRGRSSSAPSGSSSTRVAIVRLWPSRSSSPPGPIACESNDAPRDRDRARRARIEPPNRRARRLPRLWRVPVPPTESDSRDWIALTTEPLPSDVALGGPRRRPPVPS